MYTRFLAVAFSLLILLVADSGVFCYAEALSSAEGMTIEPVTLFEAEANSDDQVSQNDPAGVNSTGSSPYFSAIEDEEDDSNTNPVLFKKTFIINNEYRDNEGNKNYSNFTNFKVFLPFAKQKAMLRVDLPLVYGHPSSSKDEYGLGDVLTRINYVPFDNERVAILLGLEHYWPTATDWSLETTGKFTAGPLAGPVFFFRNKTLIFAPIYEHLVSYAGNDNRQGMNQGRVDLYTAWRSADFKTWVLLDPTLYINYANGKGFSTTIELEIGRAIGKGVSAYVRPGVGIGDSRLYNFNVEAGLQYVW